MSGYFMQENSTASIGVAYGPLILHILMPSVQPGYRCDGVYGQYQFQTPLSWAAIGIQTFTPNDDITCYIEEEFHFHM
jgi:hypothetical protein